MSWEATAWAVQQKTGSPQSKLLLVLLGNRADEEGVCWPSQINLAEQSEQSDDTVQRYLKKLENGHEVRNPKTGEITRFDPLIRRVRKRRTRGRWPGYVYQLLMPGVVAKDLSNKPAEKRAARAALSGSTEPQPAAWTEPQPAAWTEPQPAASPGRSQRLHRAAGSGVESSVESSHEKSSSESSRAKGAGLVADRPKSSQGRHGRADLLQDQIARRLGPDGWSILQSISSDQLAQITWLEQRGQLDDRALHEIRSEARLLSLGLRQA